MGKCYPAAQLKFNALEALSASILFGFLDVFTVI